MRLIDANAILKRNEHSIYDTTDLKEMIDYEPTAYDVDEVIEKLNRYKKIMKSNMDSSGHDGMAAEYYRGRMNACADFLEIIKGEGLR